MALDLHKEKGWERFRRIKRPDRASAAVDAFCRRHLTGHDKVLAAAAGRFFAESLPEEMERRFSFFAVMTLLAAWLKLHPIKMHSGILVELSTDKLAINRIKHLMEGADEETQYELADQLLSDPFGITLFCQWWEKADQAEKQKDALQDLLERYLWLRKKEGAAGYETLITLVEQLDKITSRGTKYGRARDLGNRSLATIFLSMRENPDPLMLPRLIESLSPSPLAIMVEIDINKFAIIGWVKWACEALLDSDPEVPALVALASCAALRRCELEDGHAWPARAWRVLAEGARPIARESLKRINEANPDDTIAQEARALLFASA
jgi:hypothetical protein